MITLAKERQNKIDSINIDFESDNILPGLNKEDLEKLSIENKPVMLKKSIIDKNRANHPEVNPCEYNEIIGNALYNPYVILPGGDKKPYYNFISKTGENKNAITLLQVENTNSGYLEIVNFFRINDKALRNKERKAKK